MLVVTQSFTTLPHTFSAKILAKILTVFIDTSKPKLTVSEACHRLAPIEGQKENRTLEKTRGKMT